MNEQETVDQLARLEQQFAGTFHARAVGLDYEKSFSLRDRVVLPTASTFKLFVLCELFRQAREKSIDLQMPITWKPEFHRGGDGVLRAMAPGQKLSVYNMAVLMMMISDNVATATLVDLVGANNVTKTMRSHGLRDTDIHDGLPGGPNMDHMQQPVSSAYDLSELMRKIHRHEILTPKDCDEIIRVMRANRCNDMLPRYIPVGEDWGEAEEWIANKTGYGACRVEVGIVHHRTRTFAIGLFFKPQQNLPSRYKCLADYPPVVATAQGCRLIHDHMIAD